MAAKTPKTTPKPATDFGYLTSGRDGYASLLARTVRK